MWAMNNACCRETIEGERRKKNILRNNVAMQKGIFIPYRTRSVAHGHVERTYYTVGLLSTCVRRIGGGAYSFVFFVICKLMHCQLEGLICKVLCFYWSLACSFVHENKRKTGASGT